MFKALQRGIKPNIHFLTPWPSMHLYKWINSVISIEYLSSSLSSFIVHFTVSQIAPILFEMEKQFPYFMMTTRTRRTGKICASLQLFIISYCCCPQPLELSCTKLSPFLSLFSSLSSHLSYTLPSHTLREYKWKELTHATQVVVGRRRGKFMTL